MSDELDLKDLEAFRQAGRDNMRRECAKLVAQMPFRRQASGGFTTRNPKGKSFMEGYFKACHDCAAAIRDSKDLP